MLDHLAIAAELWSLAGHKEELDRLSDKVRVIEQKSPKSKKYEKFYVHIETLRKLGSSPTIEPLFDPWDWTFALLNE